MPKPNSQLDTIMIAAQQAIQIYRQQRAAAETAYRQNNRPTVYFRDHIAAAETMLQTLR